MEYNEKWQEELDKETRLTNSADITFTREVLGMTSIDISGKECSVLVVRGTHGNIEIIPIGNHLTKEGGWIYKGTCVEGFEDEIIITAFRD